MATLAQRIADLATAIGSHIKTAIVPRLLPSGGSVGQFLGKTGAGDYASGWVNAPGAGFSLISKQADEARAANTTLTADAALKVALAAGVYRVRLLAFLTTANANMDFKYDVNFTGTASWKAYRRRDSVAGVAAGTDNETTSHGTAVIGSTAKAGTTTGVAIVQLDGVINVTAPGELQFRWAQNTSDAANLACLEGSTLEYLAA